MKFFIKVKPNSKEPRIEKISQNQLTLWVRAPAQEGKANKGVVEALSEYFSLAKNRITIIKGKNSKSKVVEVI